MHPAYLAASTLFLVALVTATSNAATAEDLGRILLRDKYAGINLGYLAPHHPPDSALGSPRTQYVLDGGLGYRGYHPGIDYAAVSGTPVYSPVAGTVSSVDAKQTLMGRMSVKIEGTTDEYFIFLHLSEPLLRKDDPVSVGTIIGRSGDTGAPAHLHVEARKGREMAAYYFGNPTAFGVNFDPVLVLQRQNPTSPPGTPGVPGRTFIIDAKAATFEGIRFGQEGTKAIKALVFPDENLRKAALASFSEFMKPPRKTANMSLPVPGAVGVVMRFNAYSGEFAQLEVTSPGTKTKEGLGVGSTFQEFVASYGQPETRSYPNNVTLYTFPTANRSLSISLRSNVGPVTYFMVAYDLKRGR